MSFGILPFLILLAVGIIWAILNALENSRAKKGLPRHSGLRLIFAAIGLLAVLFSGGCGALFAIDLASRGGRDQYVSYEVIAVLSLPVVAVGLLICFLSMRRGKS